MKIHGESKVSLAPSELLTGLPAFHAEPTKTLATGNNCKVAIFADATVDNFNAYCAALKNAGYEEYSKTNFDGEAAEWKNSFATYVSDDRTLDLAFHEYDKFMYVSVSPRGELTLPNNQAPDVGENLPIMITQVGMADLHSEAEMCYVIRLADGSFIIYDTGFSYDERGFAGEEIYKVLRKQAPDPEHIVVSAIMLSHPHLDHLVGLMQLADKHGSDKTLTIKQAVYNFPGIEGLPLEERPVEYANVCNTEAAFKKFGPDVEIVKPRAGNVLHYPGVKFNVVYTQEDVLSLYDVFAGPAMGNATSMVTQMVTDDGTKVLFGGDHWVLKCAGQLKYRYGTFLKSYVCTLFHHGQGGGAEDAWPDVPDPWKTGIYAMAIQPTVVLWPSSMPVLTTIGNRDQRKIMRNRYFAMDGEDMSIIFEGNVWHDTPNVNGVHAWYSADRAILTLTVKAQNCLEIARYETREEYYNS